MGEHVHLIVVRAVVESQDLLLELGVPLGRADLGEEELAHRERGHDRAGGARDLVAIRVHGPHLHTVLPLHEVDEVGAVRLLLDEHVLQLHALGVLREERRVVLGLDARALDLAHE